MRFNVKKCNILRITPSKSPFGKPYTLGGQIIEQVDQAKYLGITITSELGWSAHVDSTCNKANSTLGFLKRNMRRSPKGLKELAYFSLVRSKLEYSASVWDPDLVRDVNKLDMVQRRAARFVCNDYRYDSSVTAMLDQLGWRDLANRRKDIRLALLYKVTYHLIAVPIDDRFLDLGDDRLRAQRKYHYLSIKPNTTQYENSFYPRTILEWKALSKDIIEAPSIDAFKNRLSPSAKTAQPAHGAAGPLPAPCQ